jgi:hypothetical protein
MEKKSDEYRQRVRSAIREEMIHSVQDRDSGFFYLIGRLRTQITNCT